MMFILFISNLTLYDILDMLRTSLKSLDQRGNRLKFNQYVQAIYTPRYKPNQTSPSNNRNRLLAPNKRMPLLDQTKLKNLKTLPIQQEHLAVETEIKKLGYVKPVMLTYEFFRFFCMLSHIFCMLYAIFYAPQKHLF